MLLWRKWHICLWMSILFYCVLLQYFRHRRPNCTKDNLLPLFQSLLWTHFNIFHFQIIQSRSLIYSYFWIFYYINSLYNAQKRKSIPQPKHLIIVYWFFSFLSMRALKVKQTHSNKNVYHIKIAYLAWRLVCKKIYVINLFNDILCKKL